MSENGYDGSADAFDKTGGPQPAAASFADRLSDGQRYALFAVVAVVLVFLAFSVSRGSGPDGEASVPPGAAAPPAPAPVVPAPVGTTGLPSSSPSPVPVPTVPVEEAGEDKDEEGEAAFEVLAPGDNDRTIDAAVNAASAYATQRWDETPAQRSSRLAPHFAPGADIPPAQQLGDGPLPDGVVITPSLSYTKAVGGTRTTFSQIVVMQVVVDGLKDSNGQPAKTVATFDYEVALTKNGAGKWLATGIS